MKLLIILSSLTLGIALGLYGGFRKQKPQWLLITSIITLFAGALLTLYPRVAASIDELEYLAKYIGNKPIPTRIFIADNSIHTNEQTGKTYINVFGNSDYSDNVHKIYVNQDNYEILKSSNDWIVRTSLNHETGDMKIAEIVQSNPFMVYPYIISLEDRIKILNFHVPMAWIAVLSYLISMIYSIRYLRTSDYKYDISAVSAAALGTLFAILATTSGMVWAKFNWGSFWNWDPRETSIFILLLIYFAYFALRDGIEREDVRGRSSAVYSIIAFVTVPFLVFVMPRITAGLHPGSQGDNMGGPILNTQRGMLDSQLLFAYGLSMLGFTLIYFWMLNLTIRTNLLKKKFEEI